MKRRFIRQNREIARVNSNQSQRIRNLETEISRLLAENIALREKAIRATEEAERLRISSRLGRDVVTLKHRLEARLNDVHALVEELGGLPEKAARRSNERRRRSGIPEPTARSPDEREWRNRQTLGGILSAEQEGRLPPIIEGKSFPRRTLEAAELRALSAHMGYDNDGTESPDLGPPPVAHFEAGEPIEFDSSKSPNRLSGGIITTEDHTSLLPAHLETRRRRRKSSLLPDLTGLSGEIEESKDAKVTEVPSTRSTAVVRKLEASELDVPVQAMTQDDFIYQRKTATGVTRSKPSRFTAAQNLQQENGLVRQPPSPHKQLQPTRKALAPKTTNSPSKRNGVGLSDKKNIPHTESNHGKQEEIIDVPMKVRTRPPLRIEMPLEEADHLDIVNQQPKTPGAALADVMSPVSASTEPSTKSKQPTTTEMAVISSVEDVLNGSIGRTSRRARSAVSYAEPNLRDKMRRPDKKLVGAVEGLTKTSGSERELSKELNEAGSEQNVASIPAAVPTTSQDDKHLEAVVADKATWKALRFEVNDSKQDQSQEPTSPLRDRENRQLAARIAERRNKRTHSQSEGTSTKTHLHSSSSSSHTQSLATVNDVQQQAEAMSIFDPPSSPVDANPAPQQAAQQMGQSSRPTATARRIASTTSSLSGKGLQTRRHSMAAQQQLDIGRTPLVTYNNNNTTTTGANNTTTAVMMSRPSSSLSIRQKATTADEVGNKVKRASSAQALSRNSITTTSTTRSSSHVQGLDSKPGLPDSSPGTDDIGTGTNASTTSTMTTRRRSMMV